VDVLLLKMLVCEPVQLFRLTFSEGGERMDRHFQENVTIHEYLLSNEWSF